MITLQPELEEQPWRGATVLRVHLKDKRAGLSSV